MRNYVDGRETTQWYICTKQCLGVKYLSAYKKITGTAQFILCMCHRISRLTFQRHNKKQKWNFHVTFFCSFEISDQQTKNDKKKFFIQLWTGATFLCRLQNKLSALDLMIFFPFIMTLFKCFVCIWQNHFFALLTDQKKERMKQMNTCNESAIPIAYKSLYSQRKLFALNSLLFDNSLCVWIFF